MVETKVNVSTGVGIHARPAALLVKTANQYKADIEITKDGKTFNARSLLSIMSAGIKGGETIVIRARGEDEDQAVHAMAALIQSGFKEE